MKEVVKEAWEAYAKRVIAAHRDFDSTVGSAFDLFMMETESAWDDLKRKIREARAKSEARK